MSFESPQNEEKLRQWEDALKKLEAISDNLGMLIEENIKETVAAFNVNEIPTSGSCGGHLEDDRLRYPYVQGRAQNEPQHRFEGEKEIIEGLIQKHGLKDAHEIFDDGEVENEYYQATDHLEETAEYKEWSAKNVPLRQQVAELIEEFYVNQPQSVPSLHLQPIYPGYRVEAHVREEVEDKEELKRRIQAAQEEFRVFTEFLKNRFFQQG